MFVENSTWIKKSGESFDVTMGSFDGAEVCQLVGLFLLQKLEKIIPKQDVGLYRDDGLAVLDLCGPKLERLKKNVSKLFHDAGLKVLIEVNLKKTDFLDLYLNLLDGTYKPFTKPNQDISYVHNKSNHPRSILQNIPKMVLSILSVLLKNKEIFQNESKPFQNAINQADYKNDLEYFDEKTSENSFIRKRKRRRQIIWYNPPFNKEVSTNLAAKFLQLLEIHFPKNSPLHKFLNRNTIKVSYCCLPNMNNIKSSHNKNLLNGKNV